MLGVKLALLLVLRNQFSDYMCETLYQHVLDHLEAARLEKNESFFFFLRKMPYYIIDQPL